jgi:hypothetical protein
MAIGTGSGSDFGAGNGKIADHKLTGKIHDVVDQASDKASDIAARAKDTAGVQMRRLSDLIVARPIGAVLIAFGVGYILSKFRR